MTGQANLINLILPYFPASAERICLLKSRKYRFDILKSYKQLKPHGPYTTQAFTTPAPGDSPTGFVLKQVSVNSLKFSYFLLRYFMLQDNLVFALAMNYERVQR